MMKVAAGRLEADGGDVLGRADVGFRAGAAC